MKLTASVIVRNEADRYLRECVASLLEFCDEIRILDDGSTDHWLEEFRGAWGKDGSRVKAMYRLPENRNERPSFHQHAKARNVLLQVTLDGWPDYVLAVDADEFVTDGAAVRRACETGAQVVTLEIAEVWKACESELCIREDGGWRSHPIGCVWRAETFRKQALSLRDRDTATGRVPDAIHGVPSTPSGASLLHFGWACDAERSERYERHVGSAHARSHVESILWPDERVTLRSMPWPEMPPNRKAALLARANRV